MSCGVSIYTCVSGGLSGAVPPVAALLLPQVTGAGVRGCPVPGPRLLTATVSTRYATTWALCCSRDDKRSRTLGEKHLWRLSHAADRALQCNVTGKSCHVSSKAPRLLKNLTTFPMCMLCPCLCLAIYAFHRSVSACQWVQNLDGSGRHSLIIIACDQNIGLAGK